MVEGLHLTKGEAGLIAAANFIGYLVARSPRRRRGTELAARSAAGGAGGECHHDRDHGWSHAMPEFLAVRFIGGVASAYGWCWRPRSCSNA